MKKYFTFEIWIMINDSNLSEFKDTHVGKLSIRICWLINNVRKGIGLIHFAMYKRIILLYPALLISFHFAQLVNVDSFFY